MTCRAPAWKGPCGLPATGRGSQRLSALRPALLLSCLGLGTPAPPLCVETTSLPAGTHLSGRGRWLLVCARQGGRSNAAGVLVHQRLPSLHWSRLGDVGEGPQTQPEWGQHLLGNFSPACFGQAAPPPHTTAEQTPSQQGTGSPSLGPGQAHTSWPWAGGSWAAGHCVGAGGKSPDELLEQTLFLVALFFHSSGPTTAKALAPCWGRGWTFALEGALTRA